ncbi:MAG TPA: isocitrate lyase/PEP mutase family protein [Isosphaeraceae bacterium]|jgi:2-methylisocitrate lyase-like PEP mutase family enzyme|nr:isocitrate lyase/PEP mutase family protein [Isosphaeraceae bacterium]
MAKGTPARPAWKALLDRERPLVLPAAHDALTAKIIERAGFPAYQIGGFALTASRHAFPDIDLTHFGEESAGVRDIISACSLPVLVDADDGYGDVKNVTRTILGYEAMGASAIFIEDQRAPKRCGHMSGKEVVPAEVMEAKVRAAVTARRHRETFILARTDAIEPLGVDEALRRAERYLKAGADGAYVEGPRSIDELEHVGRALGSMPLATSILEGGGKTPWLSPREMYELGFSMILYPTTVLFQVTRAIERAVAGLSGGQPMPADDSVTMDQFEEVVDLAAWKEIEKRFGQSWDE